MIKKVALFSVVLACLALAFLMFSTTSRSWREEVTLHNGNTIHIYRTVKRARCCGENMNAGEILSQEIIFDGNGVRVKWRDDITPVIFDIVDSTYYVAAAPELYAKCLEHGNPNPPFIFYRYKNNTWQEISSTDFPNSLETNLLVNYWANDMEDLDELSQSTKHRLDLVAPKDILSFNKSLNLPCNKL